MITTPLDSPSSADSYTESNQEQTLDLNDIDGKKSMLVQTFKVTVSITLATRASWGKALTLAQQKRVKDKSTFNVKQHVSDATLYVHNYR